MSSEEEEEEDLNLNDIDEEEDIETDLRQERKFKGSKDTKKATGI